MPQRPLGRDVFWWAERVHLVEQPVDTRLGRRLQRGREQVLGTSWRAVRARGITLRPRALRANGSTVAFADGSGVDVDAVLWATGYRSDYSWIDVPEAVEEGRVVHDRGVSAVPGLYFLGLPWQHSRGSALLGFVERDAAWLSVRLDARRRHRSPVLEPVPANV